MDHKPAISRQCKQGNTTKSGLAFARNEIDFRFVERAMWVEHGIEVTRSIVTPTGDYAGCYLVLMREDVTNEHIKTAINNRGSVLKPKKGE